MTILKKAFGITSHSNAVTKLALQQFKPRNTNKTDEEILTEIKNIQKNAFAKENNPSIIGNLEGGKKKGTKRKTSKHKIHKGPRGGRYYIRKGKKVYL